MSLHLIMGGMFSGKTTKLVQNISRLKAIGIKCVIIKPALDTRNAGCIQTHAGLQIPAVTTSDLLLVDLRSYDCIGIDEAQFFPNLVPAVRLLVEKHKKKVFVAGLNGDFRRKRFGDISDLLCLADDMEYARAMCSGCKNGELASFSLRVDESTNQTCIGGADKYRAVCRACYELASAILVPEHGGL
jgi:thymidine kinase